MDTYRQPARVDSPSKPTLSYDYAAALDAEHKRVVRNTLLVFFGFLFTFGAGPVCRWFGWMGIPISLVAYVILAVFFAVRYSRGSSVSDIDEFEANMMAKYRRRARKTRHGHHGHHKHAERALRDHV